MSAATPGLTPEQINALVERRQSALLEKWMHGKASTAEQKEIAHLIAQIDAGMRSTNAAPNEPAAPAANAEEPAAPAFELETNAPNRWFNLQGQDAREETLQHLDFIQWRKAEMEKRNLTLAECYPAQPGAAPTPDPEADPTKEPGDDDTPTDQQDGHEDDKDNSL